MGWIGVYVHHTVRIDSLFPSPRPTRDVRAGETLAAAAKDPNTFTLETKVRPYVG